LGKAPFEHDSGSEAKASLKNLDKLIAENIPKAGLSIATTLPLAGIPGVKLSNSKTYIKRITYLFNTIGLCAANRISTGLEVGNFYWYEQFR